MLQISLTHHLIESKYKRHKQCVIPNVERDLAVASNVNCKGEILRLRLRMTNVKGPKTFVTVLGAFAGQLTQLKHGQEHGNDNKSDDKPHNDDDDGLDHGGERFYRGVYFL